ncbi:MAG: serine O-acetyltransferase [Oscillospiraceae bacterium]|nr:serine O-acetyltransferase [Oscillospiraceae bacterium]
MFNTIKTEIDALRERDPAARSALEVALLYPGFHAIMLHRPAHWLYKRKAFFPARMLSQFSRFLTGIEIHPGARIGRGVLIDHGSGVVIGETAVVGDSCTLYQGVTLGGTGNDTGKRHPTLGKNVTVGSGAKILGPFKIGDNVKVASNAVVLKPAPPNSTLVGMPARVVRINGKRIPRPLDHVHIPDPVAQEMKAMSREISELKRKVAQLGG